MKILVTGATGWVGSSAVQALTDLFPGIEIIGTSRSKKTLNLTNSLSIPLISNESALEKCFEFNGIVHTSFPTQNFIEEIGSSAYRRLAEDMNIWLEKFLNGFSSGFVFLPSSGVVQLLENGIAVGDTYAELKKKEEQIVGNSRVASYAIGRLWAGSGRFMRNYENYALGQFIKSGISGTDITVNSTTETFRQYCDVEQFCLIGIRLAQSGFNSVFDSGGIKISIRELAELVASRFPNSKVKFGSKGRSSRQPGNYFPTSEKFNQFAKEMGIELLSIQDQIERTILAVEHSIKTAGNS